VFIPLIVSFGSSKGGLPCDALAWLNSGSILVWSVLVLILTLLLYSNGGNGASGVEAFSERGLLNRGLLNRLKRRLGLGPKPKPEAKPEAKPKPEAKAKPKLKPPATPTGAPPVSGHAPVGPPQKPQRPSQGSR